MKNVFTKAWWNASLVRSVRTMAQAAVAAIGSAAVLGGVDWRTVASTAILAGILSLLTSVAGLPEVAEENETDDEEEG